MANTLNLGNGNWATKEDSLLAYNSENGNYKPLPFDFTRASSATVVNKDALIETVGSGEPRIDFSNDAKGALLLEPTRSNLIPYSEDFSQSEWNKQQSGTASVPIVTSNYGISPDGTQNADRVQLNLNGGTSGSDISFIGDYLTTISSATSGSFYLKSLDGIKNVRIRNGNAILNVDVTTQWKRFIVTDEISSNKLQLMLYGNSNSQSADLLIYGAQLEQGSYATSYIPTQGSAVTRVADVCNDAGNEQVINSTEGTIYGEQKSLETDFNYNYFAAVSDGTSNNRLEIRQSGTSLQFLWRVGGTYQAAITLSNAPFSSTIKYALRYSSTDIKFYVNGSLVDTINSPTLYSAETLNNIQFADGVGTTNFRGTVKECKYYNTALTDQELINLTTI
jgi:hypothetical protein